VQKRTGVTVSAVLLTFTSVIGILVTIVLVQLLARQHLSWNSAEMIIVGIICLSALGSLYVACCAAGLFRGWNRARLGSIVFGIFIAILSPCFLSIVVGLWTSPHSRQESPGLQTSLVCFGVCSLLLTAFGIWLAVYLNRASIKQAFIQCRAHAPDSFTSSPQSLVLQSLVLHSPEDSAYSTSVDEQANRFAKTLLKKSLPSGEITVARILVKVYAILCLAWSLFAIRLATSGKPYFDLGVGLHGHLASAAYVLWAVVDCTVAIGLLRAYIPAYRAALVIQAWAATSLLLWSFPTYRSRAHQALLTVPLQAQGTLQPQALILSHSVQFAFSLFYGASIGVFTWVLWSDLRSLRPSKQPAHVGSRPITEPEPPL
jgi:hypothetical protein